MLKWVNSRQNWTRGGTMALRASGVSWLHFLGLRVSKRDHKGDWQVLKSFSDLLFEASSMGTIMSSSSFRTNVIHFSWLRIVEACCSGVGKSVLSFFDLLWFDWLLPLIHSLKRPSRMRPTRSDAIRPCRFSVPIEASKRSWSSLFEVQSISMWRKAAEKNLYHMLMKKIQSLVGYWSICRNASTIASRRVSLHKRDSSNDKMRKPISVYLG